MKAEQVAKEIIEILNLPPEEYSDAECLELIFDFIIRNRYGFD